MCTSYAMMASRVTSPAKEEGAAADRAEEAGRVAISVCGHFSQSWASHCLIVDASMAHITKKYGDSG